MLDRVVQPASLVWVDGAPRSLRFDDVYYSGTGIDEARHVFLEGNQLPGRWLEAQRMVIAETGFGTGLNFLLTLNLWKRTAPPDAVLHYLAVERYPLARAELARAADAWPQLGAEFQALLKQWPAVEPGWRRLRFADGRVLLTLMFGDCASVLRDVRGSIDTWYLDGFAPSKNPAMWSPAVLRRIAELTRPNGRLATFTVAGQVRRLLHTLGFDLEKPRGFGAKREMLTGTLRSKSRTSDAQPWFRPPTPEGPAVRQVIVIGAGLAGCAVASRLAERGWQVTLVDSAERPCAGASGNPAGVLMPLLDASPSLRQRWYQTGFRRTLSYLADCGNEVQWQGCGVFATAWNAREERRHEQLAQAGIWDPRSIRTISAGDAGSWSDIPITCGGLLFPEAGWVNPSSLCASLLARAAGSITLRCRAPVGLLKWNGGQWQVADPDGRILDSTPVVVLCAGAQVPTFAQTSWLPLAQVRGQLTTMAATAISSRVRSVVTGAGYLLPAVGGCHQIGATYDVDDPEPGIRVGDHQRNLSTLSAFFPAFSKQSHTRVVGGRVGFRSVTNDYLPVVGPVPDAEAWQRDYGDLHLGRRVARYPAPSYHRGLYLVAGLGSRGLTSALLAADLVVSIIAGEPAPIETNVAAAVHPGRFLIRRFRRSSARM